MTNRWVALRYYVVPFHCPAAIDSLHQIISGQPTTCESPSVFTHCLPPSCYGLTLVHIPSRPASRCYHLRHPLQNLRRNLEPIGKELAGGVGTLLGTFCLCLGLATLKLPTVLGAHIGLGKPRRLKQRLVKLATIKDGVWVPRVCSLHVQRRGVWRGVRRKLC